MASNKDAIDKEARNERASNKRAKAKQTSDKQANEEHQVETLWPQAAQRGHKLIVLVEDLIYVGVATLLAIAALFVLGRTALQIVEQAGERRPDQLVEVLDSLLLVFIFVELLYAVRMTLQQRQILAEPFLIAGILVAIKEIIVLSVKAADDYIDKGPQFARAMTELGLLTGVVVALSLATILLRRKERELPENANTPSP